MSVPTEPTLGAHIADLSYRNYNGPRRTVSTGWWTIASMVLRINIRKVAFWIPTGLAILWALVLILSFYLVNGLGAEQLRFNYVNTLYKFVCSDWTLLMLMLLGLVVGSGAIASDTQANALLVYFARPITRFEYVLGKWVGVFLMLFLATFLPALLIYLFFLAAYTSSGFFKQDPFLLLKTFGAALIAPAIDTSLVLIFSALSRSGRVAGASFVAFYLLLGTITNVLGLVFLDNATMDQDMGASVGNRIVQANTVRSANVVGVVDAIDLKIFGITAKDDKIRMFPMPKKLLVPPLFWPLAGAGAIVVILSLVAVSYRVRAVEVVSG